MSELIYGINTEVGGPIVRAYGCMTCALRSRQPGENVHTLAEADACEWRIMARVCACTESGLRKRIEALEHAVHRAAEWGWCRESREVLMGAVYDDPERVRNAMDSSAGLVAEAIQCLNYWEALGEVREAAQALVTQELLRRKGLRGGLKCADWAHLIDRLGRCRAEAEETNAEAFLASITPEVKTPTPAPDSPDDEAECGLCGGEVDENGDCIDQCEPGGQHAKPMAAHPGREKSAAPMSQGYTLDQICEQAVERARKWCLSWSIHDHKTTVLPHVIEEVPDAT